jgi:hypothetical protein
MGKTHRYELRRCEERPDMEVVTDRDELRKVLLDLYPETVRRVGASAVYHFRSSSLERLADAEDSLLLGVKERESIHAVALFLFTAWAADYFLNASTLEGRKYSRLLVWAAIKALKQKHVAYLNLGGGIKPDDTLDQFKRRFGGEMVVGQVLKQVFNQDKYAYLCNKYGSVSDMETDYFPPYWKKVV